MASPPKNAAPLTAFATNDPFPRAAGMKGNSEANREKPAIPGGGARLGVAFSRNLSSSAFPIKGTAATFVRASCCFTSPGRISLS